MEFKENGCVDMSGFAGKNKMGQGNSFYPPEAIWKNTEYDRTADKSRSKKISISAGERPAYRV